MKLEDPIAKNLESAKSDLLSLEDEYATLKEKTQRLEYRDGSFITTISETLNGLKTYASQIKWSKVP